MPPIGTMTFVNTRVTAVGKNLDTGIEIIYPEDVLF